MATCTRCGDEIDESQFYCEECKLDIENDDEYEAYLDRVQLDIESRHAQV